MVDLTFDSVESAIGKILISSHGGTICAVEFADFDERMLSGLRIRFGGFRRVEADDAACACTRIRAYLPGVLNAVDDIDADGGGTRFQRRVWAELRKIAPGEVLTYAALALRLGMPKAVRAVGYANSLNPINIVIPCHRLVGADGALRGYSGGLQRKCWLLEHEGAGVPVPPVLS